jgi:hypothetical protein
VTFGPGMAGIHAFWMATGTATSAELDELNLLTDAWGVSGIYGRDRLALARLHADVAKRPDCMKRLRPISLKLHILEDRVLR